MGILSIQGPIKLCIITLFKKDPIVSYFLTTFHNSLHNKNVIVKERECGTIGEMLQFFRDLNQENDFSCIMIISHGKEDSGRLIYEETSEKPHPIDTVFENPLFLSMVMDKVGQDKLLFLAWCYSGSKEIVDDFIRGPSFSLHAVTSVPKSPLEAKDGAKAMALFIDTLQNLNKEMYEYEDLKYAEDIVDKQYHNVIKLWSF